MNNYWAFLPMRASNELLGDRAALNERFYEDSYLYFQDVLDRHKLTSLRKSMLTVLRGSHRYGLLNLDTDLGAGNRKAVLPQQLLEENRWVTADYSAGDVILFRALTVHAALHNASEFFMRLSVDFRYQLEGEQLTEICLQPHFERLTWEDVYADWRSDRFQYYWKNLDYKVVPFEKFDVARADAGEWDDVQGFLAYERRRDVRLQRRTERLAAILDPESSDAKA